MASKVKKLPGDLMEPGLYSIQFFNISPLGFLQNSDLNRFFIQGFKKYEDKSLSQTFENLQVKQVDNSSEFVVFFEIIVIAEGTTFKDLTDFITNPSGFGVEIKAGDIYKLPAENFPAPNDPLNKILRALGIEGGSETLEKLTTSMIIIILLLVVLQGVGVVRDITD